jgi:hypothetical protein
MRAFLTCDGEPCQIEVFQEEEMITAFRTALVDFGKSPASCSAICQPSDVGNFFKASKKRLMNSFESDYRDDDLKARIMKVLEDQKYPDEKRSNLCEALQLVVYCIRETLTVSIVRHAYQRCGQYPLNFDKQMSLCTALKLISNKDYEKMKEKLPEMVEIFKATGELTEEAMDAAGIFRLPVDMGKPKNERVLHRQRAVLMNSDECIQRFKLYKANKEANKQKAANRRAAKAAMTETEKAAMQDTKRLERNRKQRERYHLNKQKQANNE